jgi:malignant T-cell-amplified sequence
VREYFEPSKNCYEKKMFKKFDEKESVSGTTQLKSSVQKAIRAKLIENYPHVEPFIEQILPKKDAFRIVKW